MANPVIKVHSADGTVQELSVSSPLPVQVAGGGAGSGLADAADLIYITGTFAAAGLNTLVAAPGAANRIVVSAFMVQNESAVATTVQVGQGGAATFRALLQTQGAALSGSFLVGREWNLAANTALTVTLSAANSHGYSVVYYVESTG
jgi:hypothetical protein